MSLEDTLPAAEKRAVRSVAMSDSHVCASFREENAAGEAWSIWVWPMDDPQRPYQLGNTGAVEKFGLSMEGHFLAYIEADSKVRVQDVSENDSQPVWEGAPPFGEKLNGGAKIFISETHVAVVATRGSVFVWSRESGELVDTRNHTAGATLHGQRLSFASMDGLVRVYDFSADEIIRVPGVHRSIRPAFVGDQLVLVEVTPSTHDGDMGDMRCTVFDFNTESASAEFAWSERMERGVGSWIALESACISGGSFMYFLDPGTLHVLDITTRERAVLNVRDLGMGGLLRPKFRAARAGDTLLVWDEPEKGGCALLRLLRPLP